MILALGARCHVFNLWLSPTRDNWNNRSQQFHILSNIAFFEKLFEKQYAKQIIKKKLNWSNMIIIYQSLWERGRVVWFSLRFREVPVSVPRGPQRRITKLICPNNSIFLLFFQKLYEKQYAPQMIKKTCILVHTDYQSLTTIFMG